ncbi:MAG: septum site-determining protein MinC [Prochlorococcaceae cyanobacterium ETNP1_MAG_9]|nr:septum site-determining protein MinC [Prochlorococcaceae cyanobacterium ETNP1_MAG_9]
MDKESNELQTIIFPLTRKEDWRALLPRQVVELRPGPVLINCLDWFLTCKDFQKIQLLLQRAGLQIKLIQSNIPETIVSASSLGHQTLLTLKANKKLPLTDEFKGGKGHEMPRILFHQGTLRSGENLEAEGDVLLLGDVNPGAKISAGGDVLIWGRLRGTAHAGKTGNIHCKIVALQLRPLQLRIGSKVARGPAESPQPGLAEEAIVESDRIVIKPARSNFFQRS